MKRKNQVRRRVKSASLKASARVEHSRSAGGGEERRSLGSRLAELRQWRRVPKKRVTMFLDADVLAWFRDLGPGYQWEINRALRKVMEMQLRASSREL
jgi:uncharacterized protein (DUF4415 family)